MLSQSRDRGLLALFTRLYRARFFAYIVFLFLIFYKLVILHNNLHARYIDMNLLDDVIAIGSIMLISFWVFWLPWRGRLATLWILDLVLTFLIFADLVYYRYFGDFITIPVLLQAGQVGELGDSIRSLIHVSDLWLFADLLLGLIIGLFLGVRRWRLRNTQRSHFGSLYPQTYSYSDRESWRLVAIRRFASGLMIFIIGFAMTLGPIRHYTKTWAAGLFEGGWWNISLYNVTGLLGFHYYDVYRYTKEHLGGKPELSAEEKQEIQQWFEQAKSRRVVQNDTFGAYRGSNIIVVQAEAFMNFMIGKEIGGQEITPNFNRLMKESLYYSNYYHQTGQGRTSDADFSSQSSLHPLPTGSVFVRFPDHEYDLLPSILKDNGYETGAFHAYESSFWNRLNMYKAMNYDHFYSKPDYKIDEAIGWSLGDKSFFRQSLEMMSKEQQPFYSFLITLSSHHPYTLPASVQELNTGDFKGTIFGDYLQSVHYVDAALGELIEGMKQQGIWNNTILVFYGDHDNSIQDKEPYEQLLGESLSSLDMSQIMNQVPLLIHLPDGQHAGIYDEPAGQLDMAPSLLHLLGISTENDYMMGNNLFSNQERFVVLRSGAFTDGKLYYIPSPDSRFDNGSCYDLTTRKLTDVEKCRIPYEEANKRLSISDRVITEDLIKLLRTEE
ncbi:LTA synthase family protein [Paenibacillus sp. D2_2]|uniref:LTA synthase family protein n=1 Tax=Paenibacillus sp. D2_2 TaxID=3073092 RepID=UPI002814A27D|nr:LTA synthase family protein [Paenibacillus sp. D2_2]WMT39490.1 LTA synthase family protein [Paenibacillus sp. D2_2]